MSPIVRSLSLVSTSATPCGVEQFARRLASRLAAHEPGCHASRPMPTGLGSVAGLWRALSESDTLVVNLPVVAWKRAIVMPIAVPAMARLRGRGVSLILHEWADLDWKRRLLLRLQVPFATRLLYSSPLVARQFAADRVNGLATGSRAIVPIPPNIARPETVIETVHSVALRDARTRGRLVLGHFGSIYPRKQSERVLAIGAELKRRGISVMIAVIGDFIDRRASVRAAFMAQAEALGLGGDVLVTGFIQSEAELFGVLEAVDVFAYVFAEGLSSRRGSVLTCLAAGRPVVVNAPEEGEGEFAHHPSYRAQIAGGGLHLAGPRAGASELADLVVAAAAKGLGGGAAKVPPVDYRAAWDDVAAVVLGGELGQNRTAPARLQA